MNTAFVLGNGTSRKHFDVEKLRGKGNIYACNAVYRSFEPDVLIAVDPKMVHEIVADGYHHNHVVWTNYNNGYKEYTNLNYFQPSKGWSSGPTALAKAADDKHKTIYILGFDYMGLNGGKKFNNLFADTNNYKKSKEPATYYGNWLRQTESVIRTNTDTQFLRVTNVGDFCPGQLNSYDNIRNIDYDELEFRLKKPHDY
mgnify:FL=1|jgi:hypothetical protein|tara:strand:+ start:4689 stop:5285 length:597 start_codon:yes stop_codon:yes gene_type:complete